jgi:hypothetical protein
VRAGSGSFKSSGPRPGAVLAWDSTTARSWATWTLRPIYRSSYTWDAVLAEGTIAPLTSPSPIRADRLPGAAMAAHCPLAARPGAYLGRVVPATGQDAADRPPAASRLSVPVSATMMAGVGPQLPCCGDGGTRITAVP